MTFDSIQGKIIDVKQVASGTKKDGKPWRKYSVRFESIDETYYTFEDAYKDKVGQEGQWRYKLNHYTDRLGTNKTTKQLVALTRKPRSRSWASTGVSVGQANANNEILGKLQSIELKLAKIYQLVEESKPKEKLPF